MTLSSDYQASFNGVTVGLGQTYGIFAIEGFDDFSTRNGDQPMPMLWGSQTGGVMVNERVIVLGVQLDDPDLYDGTVDAAFMPPRQDDPAALLPFVVRFPDRGALQSFCRVTRRARARTPETEYSVVRWFFELTAPDPRLYSETLTQVTMTAYVSDAAAIDSTTGSGGDLAIDGTVDSGADLAIDSVGVTATGQQNIVNAGPADTYPTLTFQTDSTAAAWTLFNDTTGEQVSFAYGLVVGNSLIADMAAVATGKVGLAVSINGASTYGSWNVPRIPMRLAPGSNQMRFVVDSGSAGTTCVVGYYSAWL